MSAVRKLAGARLLPSYDEHRRVTSRFMVGLVNFGTGYYNIEYASIDHEGGAIQTWVQARERLSSVERKERWPLILAAFAKLLSDVSPPKLVRRQPLGTDDHPRHHELTSMLILEGYVLEKSWNDGKNLFRTYVRIL